MNLDERKLRILQAIIHSYITNAEPIGSRTISKKYDLGVSSATIRNEMSDLEELGYLSQPYTSAGRIPSDKAYRLYVNNILKSKTIDKDKDKDVNKSMIKEIGEIEQVLQNTAKILSKVTNYTSLATAPQLKQSKLKHIQLVPVDDKKILAVIVTESGIIKNVILRTLKPISGDHLNIISNYLNIKLKHQPIDNIGKEVLDDLINEMYIYRSSIESIISLVNQSLKEIEIEGLYADGLTNIFNFPEYNDIAKARTFLSFIENKNSVINMLLGSGYNDIEITIGSENFYEELKDCSVITATYFINGKTIGKIGVIGPTRMEYLKVISVVSSLASNLSDIISKNFFGK